MNSQENTTNATFTSLTPLPAVSKDKEPTLVIGAGEIGNSVFNILARVYDAYIRDKKIPFLIPPLPKEFRVINICFPYSESFIHDVEEYIALYQPKLTIIHSTVPPGTTRKLGAGVVHSPVNGKHPRLEQSILTFKKFVGGNDVFSTYEASLYLTKAGMKTQVLSSSVASELGKVGCTRRYGISIVEMKEFAKECDRLGVPFHEAYTMWNNNYNEGYQQLGNQEYFRPILRPLDGPIGGHCVIPNLDLLPGPLSDFIKERNTTYEKPPTKKKGDPNGKGRKQNNNLAS